MDDNIQLDAAFVERGLVLDDFGTLSPDTSTAIPTMDRNWNPDDSFVGGREYLLVFNRPYGAAPKAELRLDGALNAGGFPVLYVLAARRPTASDVIDDGDAFRFVWGRPPSPGADSLLLELEGQPLADPQVQLAYQNLSQINAGIGIGETCASGPTPALVSLVSAEASIDRVTLRWYVAEPGLEAAVERRHEGEDWTGIGRVTADGSGQIAFEDRDVAPGGRYDYRLGLQAEGGIEYGGEAHVEVPAHGVLAFLGARAGPGDRRLVIAFSLATGEPARIELLDVAGRRLAAWELPGLGPARHELALEAPARLPAGVYLVRISQGSRRAAGKAAIVR